MDDFELGDDEDFGLGPSTVPASGRGGVALMPSYDTSEFPPVDEGMVPLDSDLLFDEIGERPAEQSPVAALAMKSIAELPPSVGLTAGTSIKSTLSELLKLRMEARFKKNTPAAATAPSAAGLPDGLANAPPRPPSLSLTRMSNPGSPLTDTGGAFPRTAPGRNETRWVPKRHRTAPWTESDTARFYEGLQQFGTNLSLITMLFPGRDRVDIVRKFHTEQKRHPAVLNAALEPSSGRPIDVSAFETQSHEWARQHMIRRAAPLGEEDLSIMNELEATEHAPPRPQPPAKDIPKKAAVKGEADAGAARPAPAAAVSQAPASGKPAAAAPGFDDDMGVRLFSDEMGLPQASSASTTHSANSLLNVDDDTPFSNVATSPTAAKPSKGKKPKSATAVAPAAKKGKDAAAEAAKPSVPVLPQSDDVAFAVGAFEADDNAGFDIFDGVPDDNADDFAF